MKNFLIILGICMSCLIVGQLARAALSDDINANITKDNHSIQIYTKQIQFLTNSLKSAQADLVVQQVDLPEAVNIETQLNAAQAVQSPPSQQGI